MVYNLKLQEWFAGDLVTWLRSSRNWGVDLSERRHLKPGSCVHNGSNDDRESFWVNNNAFSAVYGRMYVSFNNFNVNGGEVS